MLAFLVASQQHDPPKPRTNWKQGLYKCLFLLFETIFLDISSSSPNKCSPVQLFLLDSFPNDLIPAAVQGKGTSGFADQTGVSHPSRSLSLIIKCDRFIPWKYLPKVRVYSCLSMSLSGQEADQPENYQLGHFELFDTQFQFYNQICMASSYFNCFLAREFISV